MHKSTVSLALSGGGNVSAATRARVLQKARELGYEPNPLAQRLARGHRNDQVCLFIGSFDLGIATEKILAIQQRLVAQELEVPVHISGGMGPPDAAAQTRQLRQLCRQRPRAILCATQRVEASAFRELELYRRDGGLVVSYDIPVPYLWDQVLFDREDNAYQAARYLLERGHRRLGISMSQPPSPTDSPESPMNARMRGFRRALAEFGAEWRDEWFFCTPTYEPGGATMARQFLALQERPTGVCVVNDYVALAFMVEVQRAGLRVPEDLSLIGHDDQPVAAYCPVPLTSMHHPADEIAETVVTLLLDRIEGRIPRDAPPRTVRVPGRLVERASVAAVEPHPQPLP